MKLAHELGETLLPTFSSTFSRHDFTLPQLFDCLVLREHMKLSYRRTEVVLRDSDWCQHLGMSKVPDHTTLYRAPGVRTTHRATQPTPLDHAADR